MKEKLKALWARIWTRRIKLISKLVRWLLTVQFIFMAYLETGPWTAINLGLVFITLELTAWKADKLTAGLAVLAMLNGELQEDFQARKKSRFKKGLKK
jgi:hypothetical protein